MARLKIPNRKSEWSTFVCFKGTKTILTTLAALTISSGIDSFSKVLAGEVELARVKEEWPEAARRLDEIFSKVRGTARLWDENPRSPAKLPLSDARFAIDHGIEKVDISRTTGDPKPLKLADIVYCVGDETAFQLYRRAGETAYEVKGIGKTTSDRDRYVALFGKLLYAHHGVMGRSMTRLFGSPGFEIKTAEVFDQADKPLMKFVCVFGTNETKEQVTLVLDPQAGWVVHSCLYRPSYDPENTFRFEVKYASSHEGVPLPSGVRVEEPGEVVRHCEFKEWAFASTPISEFNMNYYGLPDLAGGGKPRRNFTAWFVGFAVLLGAIGFLLRRVAARGLDSSRN